MFHRNPLTPASWLDSGSVFRWNRSPNDMCACFSARSTRPSRLSLLLKHETTSGWLEVSVSPSWVLAREASE